MKLLRASIFFFAFLAAISLPFTLWASELSLAIGDQYFRTVTYAGEILLYSLWLQSLLCLGLSIVALAKDRQLKYAATGFLFCSIFLTLAFSMQSLKTLAML